MKRMWKRRVLSLLLVLTLVLASASIAYAEDGSGPDGGGDDGLGIGTELTGDEALEEPGTSESDDPGIIEDSEEEVDSELFPGMPDDYQLSADEREMKREIAKCEVLTAFAPLFDLDQPVAPVTVTDDVPALCFV